MQRLLGLLPIVAPPHKVVHVADHAANLKRLQQESVERVQIRIGKVLRGQCANRQTAFGATGRLQQNPVAQGQHARMLESSMKNVPQDLMVDACEVRTHIHFDKPGEASEVLLRPLHRSQGAFPRTTGKGICDQCSFEHWGCVDHQGVVQHSIAEARREDLSPLWIMNLKRVPVAIGDAAREELAALDAHCRDLLAGYKIPRELVAPETTMPKMPLCTAFQAK